MITVYSEFLLANLWWIVLLGVLFGIGLFLLISFLINQSKKKKAMQNRSERTELVNALGGLDNVLSHELIGSRIVVTLKDYSLVDKAILRTRAGVTGFIEKTDKLTLVIKDRAEEVYNEIFR